MTGKFGEALKYLNEVLEISSRHLSKDDLASIWLNIAFCHERDSVQDAIAAAQKVLEYSDEGSAAGVQARGIVADLSGSPGRRRRLVALEKQARAKGHIVPANNLALTLANEGEVTERVAHLNRVLASKNDDYNHVRAIVRKAGILQRGGRSDELRNSDLRALAIAYSYLHSQRFQTLFDQCHEALWAVFEKDATSERLLLLFRHTSFLWRIRGQEEKEKTYLARLENRLDTPKDGGGAKGLLADALYFLQRMRLVLVGVVQSSR
jgi:tetratricopeptide (TPR) repeat protein